MAAAASGVLGSIAAAGLLGMDGLFRLHGWQWLFLAEGVPAVLLGAAVMALLASHPSTAQWLAPEERAWLIERRAASYSGPCELCMPATFYDLVRTLRLRSVPLHQSQMFLSAAAGMRQGKLSIFSLTSCQTM